MTSAAFLLAVSFLPFFEAKNDAVNNMINPSSAETVEKKACEKPNLMRREKCPACKATGVIVLEEQDFGQFTVQRLDRPKKIRSKCAYCNGSRYIDSFYNPTELTLLVAQERTKFEAEHTAKGEVPVGEAFIPREQYDKLDRKMQKLVKKAYGEPCRSCHWLGIRACRECDGNGFVKCTNKDCKNGWSVTKTESTYTKRSSGRSLGGSFNRSGGSRRVTRKKENVNVQPCHQCFGIGAMRCPDCHGRRALPCKKCSGLGTKQ